MGGKTWSKTEKMETDEKIGHLLAIKKQALSSWQTEPISPTSADINWKDGDVDWDGAF